MNKNSPMVQEFVLGAAAPHFYYPPGTQVIDEIWYDTPDAEEEFYNNSFRDALISAEVVSQLMPEEGIRKAAPRGRAGTGPGRRKTTPTTTASSAQAARMSRMARERAKWQPPQRTLPGGLQYGPDVTDPERSVRPESPYARYAADRASHMSSGQPGWREPNPMAYISGGAVRQQALMRGYSPQQATEMGDAAYYRMQSAEDRLGKKRAGRMAVTAGLMAAAGLAPELFPKGTLSPMARVGMMAGVAGAAGLAESGLPDGIIRSFVSSKLKKVGGGGKTAGQAVAGYTDRTMRRYGGIAHTPERDLIELSARRSGTSEQERGIMRNKRKNLARQHALEALNVSPDVRGLYEAMGSTPPSKGYITSAKTGRVMAHATGNTADYYVPFTMKQMFGRGKPYWDKKKGYIPGSSIKGGLRGNDYIRSRSSGGMTEEDVRTALVFGARKAEVVSPDGAEWIKFTDKAQSAKSLIPGRNFHIHRIPRQYQKVKNTIRDNPQLSAMYPNPSDRHNAAVTYLAWKYPKYVQGPSSTKSTVMRGTRPEQAPYINPKGVTSTATYGQLRAKVNQSLKDTTLPETFDRYEVKGGTRSTTARQRVARNPAVKGGIDHARKLGAKGAVTALRVGTAKDRDQAKKIIRESKLWENRKFVSQKGRKQTTATQPEQGGGQGQVQRSAVSSARTEAMHTASAAVGTGRSADFQKALDNAALRFKDSREKFSDKEFQNIDADDFAGRMAQSVTSAMKSAGHEMNAADIAMAKARAHEIHARRTQEIQEAAESARRSNPEANTKAKGRGLTGQVAGMSRDDFDQRIVAAFSEAAGGDEDLGEGTEGRAKFLARATDKALGGIKLDSGSAKAVNDALLQAARSVRAEMGDAPQPDQFELADARAALARRLARGKDDPETARRAYERLLAGRESTTFEDEEMPF